jgi:histidyl-tRNA synthetase
LNINITLKINNRKVLSGLAELMGASDKLTDVTVAIDKIDKIGLDKVKEELRSRSITDDAIAILEPILTLSGSNTEKLAKMQAVLAKSEVGTQGVQELSIIFEYIDAIELGCKIELDLSLARGLSYYTGAIFEVKANDVVIGSITGGGRYDDLTGIFGLKGVSGVGISFGADRIYDVMTQLNLFPESTLVGTKVMFTNLGKQEELASISLARRLRQNGIAAEIYPENKKLQKQFEYANKRDIPYVAIIGETELANKTVALKNMQTGEQQSLGYEELLKIF